MNEKFSFDTFSKKKRRILNLSHQVRDRNELFGEAVVEFRLSKPNFSNQSRRMNGKVVVRG